MKAAITFFADRARYSAIYLRVVIRAMSIWGLRPSTGESVDDFLALVLHPFIARRYPRESAQLQAIRERYPSRNLGQSWDALDFSKASGTHAAAGKGGIGAK